MTTERRAENRHNIPSIWATIGTFSHKCDVSDIGRSNARLRNVPLAIKAGDLSSITFYLTLLDGRAMAVPVTATVTRVEDGEVAITYDPPGRSWLRILQTLAGQRLAEI